MGPFSYVRLKIIYRLTEKILFSKNYSIKRGWREGRVFYRKNLDTIFINYRPIVPIYTVSGCVEKDLCNAVDVYSCNWLPLEALLSVAFRFFRQDFTVPRLSDLLYAQLFQEKAKIARSSDEKDPVW